MKKMFVASVLLGALSFSCQQQEQPRTKASSPMKQEQPKEDQNYQDRRRDMKMRSQGGCCDATEVETPKASAQLSKADS